MDSCTPGNPTESPEVICSDGLDNDCDGLTDGDDPDCASAAGYVSKDGSCNGKSPCYTSIQDAINGVPTGSIIMIAEGTYGESIMLNEAKLLTLQGGWDTSFQNQNGTTTLQNAPMVSAGSLTLQELNISPK